MSKWTIQELIDDGMSVHAYCHAKSCHHHAEVPLGVLRDRRGPEHPAMADDLERHLKCSKCGGKRLGLIYTPNDDGRSDMALKNAYRWAKDGR